MNTISSGIALRPQVFGPKTIIELAKVLDDSERISHIFIPDIPGSYESLEISAGALAVTKVVHIGSGVIRLLEHDQGHLLRRLETLQSLSSNRFVLGVGTGSPGPKPAERIKEMIRRLEEIRSSFDQNSHSSGGLKMPETFIATLKARIAEAAAGHSTGILMNFCSAPYARRLIQTYKDAGEKGDNVFGCYLKVFYAKEEKAADRLLAEEFVKYDQFPQYHEMFLLEGVAEAINSAKKALESHQPASLPEKLFDISLSNPSTEELKSYSNKFRDAGVSLPCIYPYFPEDEDNSFKTKILTEIAREL